MRRLLQHIFYIPWRLRQLFTPTVLTAIERAIAASETRHSGQIRVAVEANLSLIALLQGVTSRTRAMAVFTQLRAWDTEQNNGVLIYLLLAEHRVEIVADRGIHAKVEAEVWQEICQHMRTALQRGEFESAVCTGIREVEAQLHAHFPATGAAVNELPDHPVML